MAVITLLDTPPVVVLTYCGGDSRLGLIGQLFFECSLLDGFEIRAREEEQARGLGGAASGRFTGNFAIGGLGSGASRRELRLLKKLRSGHTSLKVRGE